MADDELERYLAEAAEGSERERRLVEEIVKLRAALAETISENGPRED